MFVLFQFQDPSNLEAKQQHHQAFEAELQANKWRIDGVVETGKQLTSAQHSASETIQSVLANTTLSLSVERRATLDLYYTTQGSV